MNYEEQLAELQAKIEDLKKEKAEFDALPLNARVAEILHAKLCRWNHTDGCAWYYDSATDFTRADKKIWLDKADKLIKICWVLDHHTEKDIFHFIKEIY